MAFGVFFFFSFVLTKVVEHLNSIKRAGMACIHQEIGDLVTSFSSSIT